MAKISIGRGVGHDQLPGLDTGDQIAVERFGDRVDQGVTGGGRGLGVGAG
jgi:hypothetical protein